MSSSETLRALYRGFVRQSKKFPNYNIREYIRRRARESFAQVPGQEITEEQLSLAKQQYEVVQRQSIVYNLYARRGIKNVMEVEQTESQR